MPSRQDAWLPALGSAIMGAVFTALLDLSVLATHTNTRGIGRYVYDLARGLAALTKDAGDVRLLGIEALPWSGEPQLTEDVLGAAQRLLSAPERLPHASWAYRVRLRLARATARSGADLVHSGHPNATPLGKLACPRVGTCHDLIPLLYPKHHTDIRDGFGAGRRRLDARRFRGMDHVIAISRTTADDLMRLLDVPAERITVVYNGVDTRLFQPEPTDRDEAVLQGLGVEDPFVLCVGAANWRKNSEGMIAGFARARERVPGLRLYWAGRLGEEDAARVDGAARREGVEDFVRRLGYVDDATLSTLYRRALALLFVSRGEGFGYPVIEAMAAGCPVVTSNRSSLGEIASGAAETVDPEAPEEIAAALIALSDGVERRSELRARGIERAGQFTLGRMASETLEVYRRVVAR